MFQFVEDFFLILTPLRCIFESHSFFFFSFLGWHLWYIEISRLGGKLELQLQAYATATAMPDPWAKSATYTTAQGNSGSFTHWRRPGIQPASSRMLVGYLTGWATTETPQRIFGRCLSCARSWEWLTNTCRTLCHGNLVPVKQIISSTLLKGNEFQRT